MSADETMSRENQEVRKIPKADRLLGAADGGGFISRLGHAAVMEAVRGLLDEVRARVLGGASCPPPEAIEEELLRRLRESALGSLRRVVNATGVVVHTNLGRAPLSEDALEAVRLIGRGYSNLEYDLEAGERGDRYGHAAGALCRLTEAEASLIVNNNAASVLLALAALCGSTRDGRSEVGSSPPEVIISRGQLVEIGGGFRIPDVLRQSGARLVEVGTTNRTYLADYEGAITERTRMLLSVHRSNFKLSGFVNDVPLAELAALGQRRGIWVMDDVGSGTLLQTARYGLGHEPTVQERVGAGADLVCFSGDKLLGGPQAGLLVGRREAIDRLRHHPMLRALRVGKVTIAALMATLAHYERGEAEEKIPVWRAICQPVDAIGARAHRWLEALGDVARGAEIRSSTSAVGGGSLPEVTLPTRVLALPGDPDRLAARLRRVDPPVIGRVENDALVLDPRTVGPGEDDLLLSGVRGALS